MILLTIGLICCALFIQPAYAGSYSAYIEEVGDGWSMTADGVLTLENDQGWMNLIKKGIGKRINKLVIGKEVTRFRIYDLRSDLPDPDFYKDEPVMGYDRDGNHTMTLII